MKRWNHAHTLAAGAVFGVGLASRDTWILCLLVFIAGLLVGRFWGLVHWAAEALRLKVMHARRATIHTSPQPVYGRGKQTDRIPF